MTKIQYLKKLKTTLYLKKLSMNEAMILIAIASMNKPCISKEIAAESGVPSSCHYMEKLSPYLTITRDPAYQGGKGRGRYIYELNRAGKELVKDLL